MMSHLHAQSHKRSLMRGRGVRTTVLLLVTLIVLIPFVYMLCSAFKTGTEINSWPPTIFPRAFFGGNFQTLLETAPFPRFFVNSLGMAVLSAVGVVLTSSIGGYVFAKFRFGLNMPLFGLIFATSMIPFEMYMIPLYIDIVDVGLSNIFVGMVVPYLIMSFGIFFMRQLCMQQIPDELLDAARIDGCGELRIFASIVMPLLQSGVAALAILAFVEGWNAFIWPLIMATNNDLFTMEIGLALFQTTFNVDLGAVAAGSLCSVMPIVIVFFIYRRQIMESIAMTGMKG